MSTVKVVNVQHPSASTAAVTLAADGSMTGSFPAPNRNLLYNGAMQCHQRGTSTASITSGGYFTADRWYFNPVTMGTWTQSVENDAPTGSGFRKSLKVLATTADGSPAAGDVVYAEQQLEGQDCQRIAKGTASAQQLTLSFWVKANVTGTYIAMLYDNDNTRHVSASYTVSASATWEKKTITFPADTTGALDNDNASSLWVRFWLGVGTNHSSGTLATSWASYTAANAAVGQVNVAAATNNYWQVTGVQLEVGPVATGFEFKSFGQELAECQRYYEKSYAPTVAPGTTGRAGVVSIGTYFNGTSSYNNSVGFRFKVTKRDTPIVTGYDPDAGTSGKGLYDAPGTAATQGDISFNATNSEGVASVNVACSGRTAGQPTSLLFHYVASAEL